MFMKTFINKELKTTKYDIKLVKNHKIRKTCKTKGIINHTIWSMQAEEVIKQNPPQPLTFLRPSW